MKWSDQSFVDFYELLDVWPDADDKAVRKRISELYLEARENLDHTNHRKRYYYRELYEVQLPQARLILLDSAKRQDYDQELALYWKNKGTPKTPAKPKYISQPKLGGLPGATPAVTVEDFSDFADIGEDKLPPLQMPQLRMDKEAVERRRDLKRRELIKHELVVTGNRWALIGGLTGFLISAGIALILLKLLSISSSTFFIGTGVIALVIGAASGRQTMRWAKRRIIGMLSQMPYDELLRHCGR